MNFGDGSENKQLHRLHLKFWREPEPSPSCPPSIHRCRKLFPMNYDAYNYTGAAGSNGLNKWLRTMAVIYSYPSQQPHELMVMMIISIYKTVLRAHRHWGKQANDPARYYHRQGAMKPFAKKLPSAKKIRGKNSSSSVVKVKLCENGLSCSYSIT